MKKKAVSAEMLEYKKSPDYIPGKEKLCYGIGGLMDGGGVALMSCIMLKYMTTMGIAMAIASTIMMVAKIWDAITDPLMGFLSDNTRSKYGRRKPYMVLGGISIIIAIFLLFLPVREWGMSVDGFIPYVLIMYLLWNTASTVSQVPYCSMASDISPSFKERNNANTVKLIFTAIASGLAYVLPLLFIESLIDPEGWMFMPHLSGTDFWLCISIIFGVLFGGGLILCGIRVKERIKPNGPKEKFTAKQFIKNYIQPYKNKSYRWHIAMYVSAFACMDMISALAVYYATDVWRGYELFGMTMSSMFIIAPLMVAAVVMFPLARYVMDKKSKQFAFRMGLPFYIFGGIMLAVMDPSWTPPILVPIVALIMGLGFGGAQSMPWIIFPDTLDVAELATGTRPTGTYSGMMTLARKVGGALAVGMVGWIIGGCGYIEKDNLTDPDPLQPDSVLLVIKLVLGIAVVVLITIAFLSSFKYKLNNKILARIRYFVDAKKSGVELSEEEEAERQALIAKHYGKLNPADVVDPRLCDENGNPIVGAEEQSDELVLGQDLLDEEVKEIIDEAVDEMKVAADDTTDEDNKQ